MAIDKIKCQVRTFALLRLKKGRSNDLEVLCSRFIKHLNSNLKSGSQLPKKIYVICVIEIFLFHLKSSFRSQDI